VAVLVPGLAVAIDDASEKLSEEEIKELARAFPNPLAATALLGEAGLPQEKVPAFVRGDTAARFWNSVAHQVDLGVAPGGRHALCTKARKSYPGNSVFCRALGVPVRTGCSSAGSREDAASRHVGETAGSHEPPCG
jgi:hypothetical protein